MDVLSAFEEGRHMLRVRRERGETRRQEGRAITWGDPDRNWLFWPWEVVCFPSEQQKRVEISVLDGKARFMHGSRHSWTEWLKNGGMRKQGSLEDGKLGDYHDPGMSVTAGGMGLEEIN